MFENIQVSNSFKNQIISSIKTARLSHAIILEGGGEDCRIEAAKEIAAAIVCKGEEKPCKVCAACKKVLSGNHPDIHILKKDDNAMIKVDEIRSLRSQAFIKPNESDKSVFIIAEAQNMNPSSQNALLKILEEPDSHVNFILTCPSKSALLTTVISRATAYLLGSAEVKADSEKIQKANELADRLLQLFINSNELEFIKSTVVFNKDKQLLAFTIDSMLVIIRDAVVFQNLGKDFLSDYPETAKKLSSVLTAKKTFRLYELLTQLKSDCQSFSNHNLTLTRLPAVLYDIKNS